MYTVEEVATELGVSKVTIYSKLKKFQDEVVVKQGKKYVTEKLFNLIKEDLKAKNPAKIKCICTQGTSMNGSPFYDRGKSAFKSSKNTV